MLLDEAYQYLVARQYLARHGILAPQHISLVCCDQDLWFDWYWPAASHIHWDAQPIIRRIVRWVGNVASGRDDRAHLEVKSTFVEGGTIGPAPLTGSRMEPIAE